jgi:nucleoside 2-deoxyribosyltransferase
MRIYLACTVRGDRGAVDVARHMHDHLVQRGHAVLTAHLLRDDVETVESQLTSLDVFARDLDWLTTADVVVAEASGSSYGVGFEVGYVLGRAERSGQRALVLYEAARRAQVSRLISGLSDPHAKVLAYESLSDIDAFLDANLR